MEFLLFPLKSPYDVESWTVDVTTFSFSKLTVNRPESSRSLWCTANVNISSLEGWYLLTSHVEAHCGARNSKNNNECVKRTITQSLLMSSQQIWLRPHVYLTSIMAHFIGWFNWLFITATNICFLLSCRLFSQIQRTYFGE